jgi:double-stranded uracil-DNA glycosylase
VVCPRIRSFPPIATRDAEVLILGSMPGVASLAARRYYAHPQNVFWRVMTALLGIDEDASYTTRVRALEHARIAVWDVLESCVRAGSADAAIDRATLVANDFAAFFARHRRIERVYFNGATAEACFRRHVMPTLALPLVYTRLPSTSPAHAALPFARKLEAWRAVVAHVPAGSVRRQHTKRA